MRVDLFVDTGDLEEEAEAAWQSFRDRVTPCPFVYSGDAHANVQTTRLPPGATAQATLVDARRTAPARAEFRLAPGFFSRPPAQRACILLHEALHIHLSLGRLRRNHEVIREVGRAPALDVTGLTPEQINVEGDRWQLACELLTFAQEVAVDKLVAATYAPLLDTYLLDRRRFFENGEAYRYRDHPTLTRYRLFYRLLRIDLGLVIVRALDVREALQLRRAQVEEQLAPELGDSWFRDQRAKYAAIAIDSDEPDPDPYRDLFDRLSAEALR